MDNSNNKTAKYYDIIYSEFKRGKVLHEEINLITNLIGSDSTILDLASGTARHSELLENLGYKVTCIDSSEEFIKIAKQKLKTSKIILDDFFYHNFGNQQFDLIIMMWNVVNEIALDKSMLDNLFDKCNSLLSLKGKIIINYDSAEDIEPEAFNTRTNIISGDIDYKQSWKVIEFDKRNNISKSLEKIEVYQSNRLIDTVETIITQKWWYREEITNSLDKYHFTYDFKNISLNSEKYLVASK